LFGFNRNPKYRIIPAISLSGSTVAAFDDIGVEDPDFGSIQGKTQSACYFKGICLSRLWVREEKGKYV
jgi:hypothetical protein